MIISCNDPPSSHISLKKLYKAWLVSMYRPFFHKHFVHLWKMSKYFAFKVICKKGILCHYHGIKLTVEFVSTEIFGYTLKYAFSMCFSAVKFDCFSSNSKLCT